MQRGWRCPAPIRPSGWRVGGLQKPPWENHLFFNVHLRPRRATTLLSCVDEAVQERSAIAALDGFLWGWLLELPNPPTTALGGDKRIKNPLFAGSLLFIPELLFLSIPPGLGNYLGSLPSLSPHLRNIRGGATHSSAACFDAHLPVHRLKETFIEEKHLPVGQETIEEEVGSLGSEQDIGTGAEESEGDEQAGGQAA